MEKRWLGSMQLPVGSGGHSVVAEERNQAALQSQEPALPQLGTIMPPSPECLWPKLS